MSEEKAGPESGQEGVGAGADPAAIALALGGASREDARTFLKKQGALIDDQRHHLHEQLLPGVMEKWLGVFLRLATAVVGLATAAAVAWLVWQAAHSNGLRIEPFSVPPDMAARGLTGEVMATKLLDRRVTMQKEINSARPARSYANAWGEHGIKLEIPETGISLSELDSWLREKLGHDSRISGEVVRTDKGITLTARTDDGSAPGASGGEQDIDALTDKLAEQIYAASQPFRYAIYLSGKGREEEALVIFRRLALTGDREDSMWAYPRWGLTLASLYGDDAGLPILLRSIELEPGAMGAYDQIELIQSDKGQWEQLLQTLRTQASQVLDSRQTYVAPADVPVRKRIAEGMIKAYFGAYRDSLPIFEEISRKPFAGLSRTLGQGLRVRAHLGAHDITAARAALAEAHSIAGATPRLDRTYASGESRVRQDWESALAADRLLLASDEQTPSRRNVTSTTAMPLVAESLAHLGRFIEAERAIAHTPGDCYPCLLIRAQIAEMQHQIPRADFWFARTAAQGPSLPFAEEQWGRALLTRGKLDEATAQFAIANKKVPHFADPLEGWGEALMAKNQSHLALAKFEEAEKYAPNWGRLHMKWGEALVYAGKKDEAKAQFARAAQLDLTPSEKSELARHP